MSSKIIFFIHTVNISAKPQQILSVSRAWNNMGYKVFMFTPWEIVKNLNEPIKIIKIPTIGKGHLRSFCFGLALIFILPIFAFIYKPIMIYSRQIYLESIPIFILKKILRTKYVLNINGWRLAENKEWRKNYFNYRNYVEIFYKLSYKLADYIVSVTKGISNAIVETYNFPPENILTIGNGVNLDFFKPIPQENAQKFLNLSTDYIYLFFAGSFKIWHGLDFGLRVLSELLKKERNLKLIICGSSKLDPININEKNAKDYIDKEKLNDFIIFTGFIDPSKLHLYINASTICLTFHPNLEMMKFGLSPLKIPEYMACKKPIVCTDVGGLGELIEHQYKCGLAAKAGNIQDYVSKVLYLLHNKEIRDNLAENGYKIAVEQLEWNKIAQKILNFVKI
jgi:glycosyltransferase involved in cell wall biosynthesis